MTRTRSGWIEREEVVEVSFDPSELSFADLLKFAEQHDCARRVWLRDAESLKLAERQLGERATSFDGVVRGEDLKYHVAQSELRHLPMTEIQAMRVNAAIESGDWQYFLSPNQRELLGFIRAHPKAKWPNAIGIPVEVAWRAAAEVRANATRDDR